MRDTDTLADLGICPEDLMSALQWAGREFAASPLPDRRLVKRLVQVAAALAAAPVASIHRACRTWAGAKGAYRFLSNERVDEKAIMQAHRSSTIARMRGEPTVLLVQDTTTLDYTEKRERLGGLGTIGSSEYNRGMFLHTVLAVRPDRTPLGVMGQKSWFRPAEEFGKRETWRERPIEEKESVKWLDGFWASEDLPDKCPATRFVHVTDRESDVHEFLELSGRHERVDLLVRSSWNRAVTTAEGTKGKLQEVLDGCEVADRRVVDVPRRKGMRARRASLSIRFAEVTLRPGYRAHGKLSPVTVWAIRVEEAPRSKLKTEPLIRWTLFSTRPVRDVEQAWEKVRWYTCRWMIELYHRVLKGGCEIEELQLVAPERRSKALAVYAVVAYRLLAITFWARTSPNTSAAMFFGQAEWKALYCLAHRTTRPPRDPPTIQEATEMLGQLAGHLGRTADGPPGMESIWYALVRLDLAVEMYLVFTQSR